MGFVGRQEADALAAEVHEASGGNPLLVRALVQDYAEARAAAKDAPLPVFPGDRFRQAVSGLLRRGELAVLQMAQAFAVAGEDAPITVLSGAVGLAGDMVPRVIQALQGAGLMHEGRFRNPAVRRAVREDLSPDEATALNRSLAHLLYEEGAPASTVARHLLAGGGGDARWAVGVLEEAADEARAGQRFDLALRYLEFAHELCRDTARRAGIRTRIAGLAWHVRPAGVVRHLPRLIDAARAGHLSGGDTVALVWHLLWYGRFDEAVDALERLGDIPGGPDRRTAGELGVLRLAISASSPELLTHGSLAAPPPAGQDPASADVVVEPRLQGVAVLDTVLRRGADPSTVVHAEQALRRIQLGDKGPRRPSPSRRPCSPSSTPTGWTSRNPGSPGCSARTPCRAARRGRPASTPYRRRPRCAGAPCPRPWEPPRRRWRSCRRRPGASDSAFPSVRPCSRPPVWAATTRPPPCLPSRCRMRCSRPATACTTSTPGAATTWQPAATTPHSPTSPPAASSCAPGRWTCPAWCPGARPRPRHGCTSTTATRPAASSTSSCNG